MIALSHECSVTLHRTLRIPDDGGEYPLPPSLGHLPVYPSGEDEFVVPLRRMEATWLSFSAPRHAPRALKVGVGGVDAVSGEDFDPDRLQRKPQDYLVIPDQPWLDGINSGDGFVRQFVAVPLGEGLTVEAQLTGKETEGGLQFALFDPRPGRFPDRPREVARFEGAMPPPCAAGAPMGLGAGGRMRQKIYEDTHGVDSWLPEPVRTVHVELVDAVLFEAITGIAPPGPPVDAHTYTQHGLPWFDLLAPTKRDVAAAQRLAGVRSIAELENRLDEALPIPPEQIRRLLKIRDARDCVRTGRA
jgi:hypothetical protein